MRSEPVEGRGSDDSVKYRAWRGQAKARSLTPRKYWGKPPYIEGNRTTAFAARLIPQYESPIHVTKETIQFVVTFTKDIPHSYHVSKETTQKLSQHVSHQGTVRVL